MAPPFSLIAVIPVYNEEANIATVIRDWTAEFAKLGAPFRLVCLDDGSKDGSGAVMENLARENRHLEVVRKTNSGHGRTCRAGYERALAAGAEWIFQIDSDGQCDPAFFAEVWQQRAEAEVVFGQRKTRDDGLGRVLISACCRLALWIETGIYVKDPNVPYRLLRAETLRTALAKIPADVDLQNVALALAVARDRTARWRFVRIHFRSRQGGENSIDFRQIIKLGWHMVKDLRRIGR